MTKTGRTMKYIEQQPAADPRLRGGDLWKRGLHRGGCLQDCPVGGVLLLAAVHEGLVALDVVRGPNPAPLLRCPVVGPLFVVAFDAAAFVGQAPPWGGPAAGPARTRRACPLSLAWTHAALLELPHIKYCSLMQGPLSFWVPYLLTTFHTQI